MLKAIITYYNQSLSAIDNATDDHKITLNQIKLHTQNELQKTINSKVCVRVFVR